MGCYLKEAANRSKTTEIICFSNFFIFTEFRQKLIYWYCGDFTKPLKTLANSRTLCFKNFKARFVQIDEFVPGHSTKLLDRVLRSNTACIEKAFCSRQFCDNKSLPQIFLKHCVIKFHCAMSHPWPRGIKRQWRTPVRQRCELSRCSKVLVEVLWSGNVTSD